MTCIWKELRATAAEYVLFISTNTLSWINICKRETLHVILLWRTGTNLARQRYACELECNITRTWLSEGYAQVRPDTLVKHALKRGEFQTIQMHLQRAMRACKTCAYHARHVSVVGSICCDIRRDNRWQARSGQLRSTSLQQLTTWLCA